MDTPLLLNNARVRELLIFLFSRKFVLEVRVLEGAISSKPVRV